MQAISEHATPTRTMPPAVVVGLVAAAAYWFAGYLPWILTGLNGSEYLYVVEYDHHAAAPLDLTHLGDLIRYGVIGGVCAGLCRALDGRRNASSLLAGLAGTIAALALVHLQSFIATRGAETVGAGGTDDLVCLVLISAAASCAGWALGVLALRGGLSLALVLSVASTHVAAWLMQLGEIAHSLLTSAGPVDLNLFQSPGAWRAATVPFLAAALVATGTRPHRRLAGWPIVMLISALTGATITAIAVTGLLMDVVTPTGKTVEIAHETFWSVLQPDLAGWIAYAVAVAVALAVSDRNMRSRQAAARRTATSHPHT